MKSKRDIIERIIKENDGYLIVSIAIKEDITKKSIILYAKKNGLKRLTKGTYIDPSYNEDPFYVLDRRYKDIIFSGESALYLNKLIDSYESLEINVPQNYGRTRLVNENIKVHQERDKTINLGKKKIKTKYGHKVDSYNKERCIIELIKKKDKIKEDIFNDILKRYNESKDKNLKRLKEYAEFLNIKQRIMKEYFAELYN